MSSRCPHNIVNFGPLAAEIGLPVWGTPANFNGFRDLAALLHGSQVLSVSQTFAALNRGRHLCSAGRPSRCALAHISSLILLSIHRQTAAAKVAFEEVMKAVFKEIHNGAQH